MTACRRTVAAFTWVLIIGGSLLANSDELPLFDVRQYGAVGDGKALDTAAVNRTIEACSAAGGGRVLLPAGEYLCGTVRLRSRVVLSLAQDATLRGTSKLDEYAAFSPPAGCPEAAWKRWHRALLLADGVEDVVIEGPGTIDGNRVFDPQGEEKMRGPHTVLLGNSRGVTIRDLSIRDSANYAILFEFTDRVEIRNVTVTGGWDGVHFRGWKDRPCRDVTIAGCRFHTGDDAIAGRFWDRVEISDCEINSSCNCVRLIGPAEHLTIERCRMFGPGLYPHRTSKRTKTLAALNLQPGGWDPTEGRLDDVRLADLTIENVTTPFHFVLKPGNSAGRIAVERVRARGVYQAAASVESWAETPFEEVTFRDVHIEFEATRERSRGPVRIPAHEARPLPSWGFYFRNARTIALEDVRITIPDGDSRPALWAEDVERLALDRFAFARPSPTRAPMTLERVGEVAWTGSPPGLVDARCLALRLAPAGKPLALMARVESAEEGLARVEILGGAAPAVAWVWLKAGKAEDVYLEGITPTAGADLHCGDCRLPPP